MTQPLDTESPTVRLSVPVPETLVERIEEWRAQQRPVLSKAAAARRLIEMALEVEEQGQGQAKPKSGR